MHCSIGSSLSRAHWRTTLNTMTTADPPDLLVIDADGHTFEPRDLLERYLDKKYRGRIGEHASGPLIDGRPAMQHPPGALEALRFDPQTIGQRFGDIAADHFSAQAVRRALDVEGIDVSVLYGPLYECWIEGMDPELAYAIARAYSRWLVEYIADAGGRLLGAAPIPFFDVELALRAIDYAVHELGLRAFWTRPNPVGGRMLGEQVFDPIFDAIEGLDAPLCFHEGSGSLMHNIGTDRFGHSTWFEQHACVHPMEQQMLLASLVVQGVFERHPRLRVAFLESGAAWAPAWLHRLDEHAELVAWKDAPSLTATPTEYFKRQCFISCDPGEELLYQVVDFLGAQNVVFATDFPHPDAKYPNALKSFLELPRVDAATKRKILWDNALRLYGLEGTSLPRASR